jgi:hypothetical protein
VLALVVGGSFAIGAGVLMGCNFKSQRTRDASCAQALIITKRTNASSLFIEYPF